MTFIQLSALEKSFGATRVVQRFDLDLARGEFVSLLGPSGCGKTTVLRMVAGFESPDAGDIVIDGQSQLALSANRRQIGMVFQSYALFPNLTVAGNVGFGLRIAGMARAEIARRVDEMLEMVGLSGFQDRFPWQLSGGQQQRVALARAIAPRPRVLLLDEPLSALDAKIRVSLRAEIRSIQRHLGITTLFATHDQEEALSMSDRIVVMSGGRAEQVGTPEAIYARPASRFVAEFIGTLNVLPAKADGARAVFSGGAVDLPDAAAGEVALAIRPEALRLTAPGAGQFDGVVEHVEYLGSFTRLHVRSAGALVLVDAMAREMGAAPALGQGVGLAARAEDWLVLGA